jgi:hypothetical protein
MLSKRGEPNKVDEAFISPVNEFELSSLTNSRRVNLRTMSARQLQRLETKVDERHGWALARSQEEVRALKDTLDEHNYNYDHLLEKEAFGGVAGETTKKKGQGIFDRGRGETSQTHRPSYGGGAG